MENNLKHLTSVLYLSCSFRRCFSCRSVANHAWSNWFMVATLVAAIVFAGSISAEAQLYQCKDRKGRLTITNVPSFSDCTAFLKKKNRNKSWRSRVVSYNPAKYDDDIVRIGKRYRIDPKLIKAIIHTESDFDHRAVSKSGAQGLMQLMPETAKELKVANPFNPRENIDGGTRYFKWLLKTFNGDLILSIAAYNAGPTPVKEANGIPQIPETVRYVKKVLRHYKAYKAAS